MPIIDPLSTGSMAIIRVHHFQISNLVNFRPTISEFSLLKLTIFTAIWPQFDDDLHSSRWRFQTDWKIATFISAEQSAIISVQATKIW